MEESVSDTGLWDIDGSGSKGRMRVLDNENMVGSMTVWGLYWRQSAREVKRNMKGNGETVKDNLTLKFLIWHCYW